MTVVVNVNVKTLNAVSVTESAIPNTSEPPSDMDSAAAMAKAIPD
jgi:hypothetical protein